MLFTQKIDDEIELAFLQKSMASELCELITADAVYLSQWLPWVGRVRSVADSETFISESITSFSQQKSLNVAIHYEGKIVGVAGYNHIHTDLKKVVIGYWLGSKYQGKGIITRVVKFLIQNAFDNMAMEKIEIAHSVGNIPSQKVIERCGFTQEGIIKNAENLNGKIVDHVIYGIYK